MQILLYRVCLIKLECQFQTIGYATEFSKKIVQGVKIVILGSDQSTDWCMQPIPCLINQFFNVGTPSGCILHHLLRLQDHIYISRQSLFTVQLPLCLLIWLRVVDLLFQFGILLFDHFFQISCLQGVQMRALQTWLFINQVSIISFI